MRSAEHHSHFAREVSVALRTLVSVSISAGQGALTLGFLAFVLSLTLPTSAQAQTVVQHGIKEGTTTSLKLSLAFGSNTTAGDTAVATFAISSGTQTGTVTDSLGTACHQGPHIPSSSSPALDLEQWYCPNLAGGADTVTVTISGSVQRAVTLEILELSGVLQNASVLDQSATAKSAASATAVTGTTSTTTSASEIAIGAVGFVAARTLSTGPAHGSTLDNQSTTVPTLFTADQIVTSTGALSNSWTMTTNAVSLGLIGTYVATHPTATATATVTATPTATATATATVTSTATGTATATPTATATVTATPTATATVPATTKYVYDELGRLAQVIDAVSGNSATYHYDAVGNLLSITTNSPTGGSGGSSSTSISEISPDEGPVGTQVTISGSGFSSTVSSDSVSFNGTTATINSASANSIVATVPSGATSGPVTVTSPNGSATSGESFTVTAGGPSPPAISGFTPTVGTAGTAITISGTNFDSDPTGEVVRVGATVAPITSATTTTINTSVPSMATTGPISVTTSAGFTVTGDDFYVPPGGYTASSISVTGQMSVGGSPVTASFSSGSSNAIYAFQGSAGQQVSLVISNSNLNEPNVSILAPDGSMLASTTVVWSGAFIDVQTLPATGTYTVFVNSGSSPGSITLQLLDATTEIGAIAVGGPAMAYNNLNPGQDVLLTFSGTAGQQVSLGISNSNLSNPIVSILNPDGSTLTSTTVIWSGASIDVQTLPTTGTYTVMVDTGSAGGHITVQLYDATTKTGPIIVGGSAVTTNVNLGQDIKLTFSGTAGQQVSAGISNSNLSNPIVSILNPDGSTLTSTTVVWSGALIDVQTLPTSGTYTVFVDTGSAGGSITLQLYDATTENGPISIGGAPVTSNVNVGQDVFLTFNGTAGQQISLGISNSNLNDPVVSILKPDGSTLASTTVIWSGAFIDVQTLPTTGTYTVFIDTGSPGGTITVQLYDASAINGTITVGGNVPETVRPGQDVYLTFSGTAGQQVSLLGYNSNLNDPVIGILNPDLSTLASTTVIFSSAFVDVMTLPTTGTYTVFADTGPAAGNITLELIDATTITGPITVNGSASIENVNAGQDVKLTFSGTAGQQVTLNAFNSNLNSYPVLAILNPDGSTLSSCTIVFSSCSTGSQTLGSTGTYTAYVDTGSSPGTITLSVTSP